MGKKTGKIFSFSRAFKVGLKGREDVYNSAGAYKRDKMYQNEISILKKRKK